MTITAVRHRLEYGAVVGVRALLTVLPDSAVRACGAILGGVAYALAPSRRRLAVSQLSAAFPEKSPAECRHIARATFAHFGRLLAMVLKFSTLSPEQMRARLVFDGADHLRQALAAGKGAIVVTGHFSYWEIQGVGQALELPSMYVLARPLDNPHLHALFERIRCATGNQVIYRQGALRRALRALGENRTVGVLIDQHILGTDAVRVEFFHRPAATSAAVAMLAQRTGAAVIPIFSELQADGRFRLIYESPIAPPADGPEAIREFTQRCSDALERRVRRDPHLWLWMHHRWREPEPEPRASADEHPVADRLIDESRGRAH